MSEDSAQQAPDSTEMPLLARDEVTFDQLGDLIETLSDQLRTVATRAEASDLKRDLATINQHDIADEDLEAEVQRRIEAVLIRTLSGLKQFRRNYEYWERAITEYALTRQGLTQRDAARYLGVAGSTINRWWQNPLEAQEARD